MDDEHGVDAAQQLWQLVGGNKRLTAYVERRERLAAAGKSWGSAAPTKLHLTLVPAGTEDLKQSANAQLLATGLARLVEPKGPKVGAGQWWGASLGWPCVGAMRRQRSCHAAGPLGPG